MTRSWPYRDRGGAGSAVPSSSLRHSKFSQPRSGALDQDEPLAADVRPCCEANPRAAKRSAKLRLHATILGCRFDDLRRREQERWNRWLALVATITEDVGLVVVASLAVAAFSEKTIADQKTIEATANEKRARESPSSRRARRSRSQPRMKSRRAPLRGLQSRTRRARWQGCHSGQAFGATTPMPRKLALAAWPRSAADERPMAFQVHRRAWAGFDRPAGGVTTVAA